MIKQHVFSLTPLKEKENIHFNMGSVMHGFLIQSLAPEIATALHGMDFRPYSQYVYCKTGQGYWQINSLTATMASIIDQLSELWQKSPIYLKQRNAYYQLHLIDTLSFSYRELANRFFLDQLPARRIILHFEVPTSFKSNGEYQLFPQASLITASSYKKWNALSNDLIFDDREVWEEAVKEIKIEGYRLHSMGFSLEKTKIIGFAGDVTIYIGGPDMTARWFNLLLAYGEFCGIGIKTSLGMGGVTVYSPTKKNVGDVQTLLRRCDSE